MKNSISITVASLIALLTLTCASIARDQIHIVGSSTVFPFAIAVAEDFGQRSKFKTPIIESTGSGGGFKLFCAGTGLDTPDITNASRRIKAKEFTKCHDNGVKEILEVMVGYDGIVVANAKSSPNFNLTREQIYLALAKHIPDGQGGVMPNNNQKWSDVDPLLPDTKIEVLGPPPTSGTRDAFEELVIEGGCKQYDEMKMLKSSDKKAYKRYCREVREDGPYIDAGENDNLIVSKLSVNENALGIFGFSFLDQNLGKIKGANVDGVTPTFENIASGEYPVSRSLFFYVKKAHLDQVPGIYEYVRAFVNDDASGIDGHLLDKGLIPASEEVRNEVKKKVDSWTPLSAEAL